MNPEKAFRINDCKLLYRIVIMRSAIATALISLSITACTAIMDRDPIALTHRNKTPLQAIAAPFRSPNPPTIDAAAEPSTWPRRAHRCGGLAEPWPCWLWPAVFVLEPGCDSRWNDPAGGFILTLDSLSTTLPPNLCQEWPHAVVT
jgi:hypothetical protein